MRDTRDYERLLREKLYKIPGIRHSKSHFVLRVLKEAGASADQLLPIVSTIVACGFVVDMSPLSTSGAIYLANAHASEDKNRLFKNLLIWGLSIAFIGAVISWLAFTVLAIP